jgi:hypothetical protein
MKIHFENHDEHEAFTNNGEAVSSAVDLRIALGLDEFGVECDGCDNDEQQEDGGERMKYYRRSADGSLEVREQK